MKHPIDSLSGLLLDHGPERLKFFSDGWGSSDYALPTEIVDTPPEPLPVVWLSETSTDDLVVAHGSFTSPSAALPHRSQKGSILSLAPTGATKRVVLLMPAWNEHEPRVRVALAKRLARRGIRTLILENPYYGTRHPDPTEGQPIRTVGDFMVMGGAAVTEARGILSWLTQEGWEVGVSGYSMGGNTAALASATVPFPVATAALAASHSPGPVFLDGVLRGGIAWDALGGDSQEEALRAALNSVSVLDIEPQPHTAAAVVVGARSDGYVPSAATHALAEHWPGSDLRTISGGHATLVWFRKDALADAIVDAFERMDSWRTERFL
ncbi:MAG: alpha/beta hydrolase family protein [Acidimicrobiia bacterium]